MQVPHQDCTYSKRNHKVYSSDTFLPYLKYIPLLAKYPLKYLQEFSSFFVNIFLCLIRQHAMKAYRGVEVYFHSFIASKLDEGFLLSTPWIFIPRQQLKNDYDSNIRWMLRR
jgi:hypothetical protein